MLLLDEQLKNLQNKLQLLVKQNQLLEKQKLALQMENERLLTASQQKDQLLQSLYQQLDVLKLNAGALDDTDKKNLLKRIDGYLADIQKCITLLNE